MADRVDHAAKAVEFGNLATDAWNTNKREYASALLASAQAHATLALVEQQRIANLIALSESDRATVNGARSALGALYFAGAEGGSASMTILPNIAAALGIEVD